MAMTNFMSARCLVLLCSAIFLGSSTLAAAQKSGLDGTYILDETDSDNMNEVIEDAVEKLRSAGLYASNSIVETVRQGLTSPQ